jgi:hypothetical protein
MEFSGVTPNRKHQNGQPKSSPNYYGGKEKEKNPENNRSTKGVDPRSSSPSTGRLEVRATEVEGEEAAAGSSLAMRADRRVWHAALLHP